MFRKKKKKTRAFTLLELIVVLVILSILGTIAVLSYSDVTKSYRDAVAKTNLQVLKSAVQVYRLDHSGDFPTDLLSNSTSKNGLEQYLDDEMINILKNVNHPYQYSLKFLSGNIIIQVIGPDSFKEEVIVTK